MKEISEINNTFGDLEFNEMLTKDEFRKLCEAVRRDGQIDEAEVEKLVNWAIKQRSGAECVNLMIEGFLTIGGWNGDDPQLLPPDEIVKFIETTDFRNPMLEEMKC